MAGASAVASEDDAPDDGADARVAVVISRVLADWLPVGNDGKLTIDEVELCLISKMIIAALHEDNWRFCHILDESRSPD